MFDIRDHLEKLDICQETSRANQIKAICPVCHGNDLTVNMSTGAYSCYNNNCDTKIIKRKLGISNNLFKNASPFKKYSKAFLKPKRKLLKNTYHEYKDNYIPPTTKIRTKESHYNNKTIYVYDKNHVVEKVVTYNITKGIYCKAYYPKYRSDAESVWNYGNDKNFPIYLPVDIATERIDRKTANMFVVEGEKCADLLCSIGVSAITFLCGDFRPDIIKSKLKTFIYKYGIYNYTYIPDHDKTGIQKMNYFLEATENVCRVSTVTIETLYKRLNIECRKGDDIGDLISDHKLTKEKLINILRELK